MVCDSKIGQAALYLHCVSAERFWHKNPPPAPPEASKPLAAVAAAPPEKLILKEGADVNLKFAQDLNSKTANDDDPVSLVLDQSQ
jgi:hypothetical protein